MNCDPKSLIGRPIDIDSLTEYQSGSVVSRMVINKKTGTVTAFAFEADEGLSEHTAPYDALAIALEGEADIPVGGVPQHLKQGQMIIMPANVPHAVCPTTRFKMMLVMIHE
ncbi:MAG: cupin domain-containing protein [Methanocalculaceae archaeon]|jgi:quercetin dioxygenase-like cupin family protein|nr:cupin domain-containing protein [Methanocalculaceae archaeon]